MKVKYLADANFNEHILTGLLRREPAIDFARSESAGLAGLSDLEVLRVAAAEGRILVTHDRRTMPAELARFAAEFASPGVLVVSQKARIRDVIEELLLIWIASEADEWAGHVWAVPL